MTKMLTGVRVLDFTTTIAGPHCTRLFADLGAEVIKIEAHDGDVMRSRPPLRNGASTTFGHLNAGKKSVVLDLKLPMAIDAVRRLVATSDFLVENFRPGVMRRFGLDYEALTSLKPSLIYCAISGYGQTGPSSQLPAYAPVIHAASGYDLAYLAYQDGRSRPDFCGVFIADVLSGTYAFGALLAALEYRRQTGRGQMIDVSMLESMLSVLIHEIQAAQFHVPPSARPIFGPIATADGYVVLAVASEKTFQNLAGACGREDWIIDPRFARYLDRRANWGELIDEVETWSKQRSAQAVQAVFEGHGVPSSLYRTVREVMNDPQILHRGSFAEVQDAGGAVRVLNPPFRMSDTRVDAGPQVPALGEHSSAVLTEIGYTSEEIKRILQGHD
jgi:crotonobetainyl-CoA:carnitine CoA-transferase CaiB-like acyl-CoA transferase